MILNKLLWATKRHPFLYLMRFRLLAKNSDLEGIETSDYNTINTKSAMPKYFVEVNNIIFSQGRPESDLETIKQISIWLNTNIKGGPGLSEPSEQALKTMLSGKGGVCSDIAQIFNNFCVINDIRVREWGTTSAPFDRAFGGHSFNEVFIKELDKWVLVDVSYNIFFYGEDDKPLSVIEVYQAQRKDKSVVYENFGKEEMVTPEIINKNYLNPSVTPFLICNYRNRIYDKFLRYTRPYIPVFITHFAIYLINKSYYYKFPMDNYKKIFN